MLNRYYRWSNDSLKRLVRDFEKHKEENELNEFEENLYKDALEELNNRKLCKLIGC